MHPPYAQAEWKRRIVDGLERGWGTLTQLTEREGWPHRQTVYRWTLEDPQFAQQLAYAQDWRRAMRREAFAAPCFNPNVAEEMLARVRRGEAIRDLVRTAGMPHRDQLNRWKLERPDFAQALAVAAAGARFRRKRRWSAYEEAVGDQIIVRLVKGASLPQVLADPKLPGITIVKRWRRDQPGFDSAVKTAHLWGHRVRMRRRRQLTPALREEILVGLAQGHSLRAISFRPGVPHLVTLHAWMRADADFARYVALAREEGELALLDRAARLAAGTGPEVRAAVGEIFKQIGRMRPRQSPATDET